MTHFKKISQKNLGEVLIERGIINHQQLEMAFKHQKQKGGLLGEILVELNFVTEKDIAQALTAQYGFPYLPLANYEIDREVLTAVPAQVCRKYCLVPIDKIGKSLTIAMANPLNQEVLKEIETITGCNVQTFVSTSTEIKQTLDKYFSP